MTTATATRRKAAEPKEAAGERQIVLIAADSGAGKSFFVANLGAAVIYDTDVGGGLAYAEDRIRAAGSERVEVSTYREVLDDLRRRQQAGTLHRNVVIDHVTGLQQEAILRHNPDLGADYGRSTAKATAEFRKIREFVRHLDCNFICTAHLKAEFQGDTRIGSQADGARNVEADFAVVLYLEHRKGAAHPATARVIKWRRDPDDPRGAIPLTFKFTVEEFRRLAGAGMDRAREPVALATPEQVVEITRLVAVVKLPDGWVEGVFRKANAEAWTDLTADQAEKCLTYLRGLITGKEK